MNGFLGMLLLVGLAISTTAAGVGGTYKVDRVKGDVQTWSSKRQRWLPVNQGDAIAEGALMQLESKAMVRVKGLKIAGKIPQGFSIRAQEAMVFRLERQSVRKFRLGGYHVPLPPNMKKKQNDGLDNSIEPALEEVSPNFLRVAWEQAVSIFDDTKADQDATAQETQSIKNGEQDLGESHADNTETLRIIHPKMGANLFVDSLPTTVVVIWQDLNILFPEKNQHQYQLTFWRDVEVTSTPVAVSSNDRVKIDVNAEGRYYMRVQSLDGRYRSAIYSFTVNLL